MKKAIAKRKFLQQKRTSPIWLCGAAACLMLWGSPAWAQSVDYQSFEALFGEPVTTSVTGSPQRASEVPATMEIITADEIRRSGARDIPGVLRHVAGMDVMQWTNNQSDVGVRGYDQAFTPRLLVLINGRQVYSDDYGYTQWSALAVNLSDIRQIEIVKGPNSALYGFNAVGGVINIITYSALDANADSAALIGGTQGLLQGTLLKSWKLAEKSAIQLSVGYSRDSEFTTPVPATEGTASGIGAYNAHVALNGVFQLTDAIELRIDVSHGESRDAEVNPAYFYAITDAMIDSVRLQVNADTKVGLVQLAAYSNWTSQKSNVSGLGYFDFENNVNVVQLQDVLTIGSSGTLRISAEYRHNALPTTPLADGEVSYDVYSTSGMWQWNIAPDLSWTNAVRFDNLNLNRSGSAPVGYPFPNADWNHSLPEYTFNTGLVWRADDSDTLRAMVGRGVQLPSLANFGGLLIQTPFSNVTGFPNVNPTAVMNYELGWDKALASLGGKFRASVFYQNSSNIIAIDGGFEPTAGVPYVGASNIGSSFATGLELEISGTLSENWRWGANYRYEAVHDKFDAAAAASQASVDYQHVTPAQVANLNLGWSASGWEVDGFAHIQSATQGLLPPPSEVGTTLTPVGAYVSADGRIAYRINDAITLAVSGQNLLTSAQKQTSGPAVQRVVFATLSSAL